MKVHNRPNAKAAKTQLRLNVLEAISDARVFDAFCGPIGEMYATAWHKAKEYVGCDMVWRKEDKRRRFVGDTSIVMRSIDLSKFNVFDIDAFGAPWAQVLILAARRKWAPGELGGLCLTDGSSLATRFGGPLPRPMSQLLGSNMPLRTGGTRFETALNDACVRRWAEVSGVEVLRKWKADSKRGATGSVTMHYSSLLFRGLSAPLSDRAL